ncbi:MAG: LysR family transcriptional regulator [Rhodospirillales bacterium]|nr:LysR family transcriptional regulator [Rhodospirillales bacterium]
MKDVKSGIPSTSALLAFEATARLGSVAHAAEELEVSSPAISRHIGNLESALNVRLFERKGRGLVLTRTGEDYFSSVQPSIQSLRAASNKLHAENTIVTIGCTQTVSVMILLPLYARLKRLLDESIELRTLNCEYDMLPSLLPVGIDVLFECSAVRRNQYSERLLDEEVVPVASPSYFKRFRRELAEHPSQWLGVPRLDWTAAGTGWTTWETWFKSQNCRPPEAPIEKHEIHFHLTDAAARGQGLALGWNGYLNSDFETGRLIPVRDEWLQTKSGLYAYLTTTGQRNPSARRFLTVLAGLTRELKVGSKELRSIRERWAGRESEITFYRSDAPGKDGLTTM